MGNIAPMYDMRNRIHDKKQGESSMTAYYNRLWVLRQGLDHYQPFEMEAIVDTTKLNKLIKQERIFESLVGLNLKLDQVRA